MNKYGDRTITRAANLRASGYTYAEISHRLNVSYRTVYRWLNTDYAERARASSRASKLRHIGKCQRCGGITKLNGHKNRQVHPNGASLTCSKCQHALRRERRFWTPERIVERLREVALQIGRPPTCNDAQIQSGCPSVRAKSSSARIAEAEAILVKLPPTNTVKREFGSWPAALDAAGLSRPARGGAAHRKRTDGKPNRGEVG